MILGTFVGKWYKHFYGTKEDFFDSTRYTSAEVSFGTRVALGHPLFRLEITARTSPHMRRPFGTEVPFEALTASEQQILRSYGAGCTFAVVTFRQIVVLKG